MDLERALELLNEIVDYEHIARNNSDAILHLLRMGFTPDELVDVFGHCREDVDNVANNIESED